MTLLSSSAQFPFLSSSLFFNPCMIVLFVTSVCPFVWGCATEVNLSLIPRSEQKFLNFSLPNYFPLFVINVCGIPNLQITSFQKKCCIRASVIVGTAFTSIHLVKWSIATISNFFWAVEMGNGPKMSIPQTANGQGLPIGCWMFEGLWIRRAYCWHLLHF